MEAAFFYPFAFVLIVSAVLTLFSRSPVHSVLWLILAFFNAAALFLMLGAEFLAMVLVIVYVGAVAVLFLFVVMMLDVGRAELRSVIARHWPLAVLVGAILLVQMLAVALSGDPGAPTLDPMATRQPNIEALGQLLFTRYAVVVEIAGLILIVALMSAVLLATRVRKATRRQRVGDQVRRRPADSIRLASPPVGRGLGSEFGSDQSSGE